MDDLKDTVFDDEELIVLVDEEVSETAYSQDEEDANSEETELEEIVLEEVPCEEFTENTVLLTEAPVEEVYETQTEIQEEPSAPETTILPEIVMFEEESVFDTKELEYDDDEIPEGKSGLSRVVNSLLIVFGIFVAVVAIIVGISVLPKIKGKPEPVDFSTVGNNVAEIGYIGEENIPRITAAQSERLDELFVAVSSYDYTEADQETGLTQVRVNLTTILKDLKIKFVNSKNKLIANVPFQVEIVDSKGNTVVWTDTDKDGIIYQTDLNGGAYTVKLVELEGYDTLFDFRTAENHSVSVKTQLDYKKVDVSNEVKQATQVNTATEDTAEKEVAAESSLKDTIAYVISSKTANSNGYEVIADRTAKITDPIVTIRKINEVASIGRFARLSGKIVDVDETTENTGGENSEGGNAEGGNAEGGNTEGGNTEGGNTEGGNTEGGNTEGGNTEGGNTEGGNTEVPPVHTHNFTAGYTSNGNGTHTGKCECGENGSEEACSFGTDYITNEGKHHQKCSLCGYETADTLCKDENADGVCDVCGKTMPAIEASLTITGTASYQLYLSEESEVTANVMFSSRTAEITKYEWKLTNGDSIVIAEANNSKTITVTPVKAGITTLECTATLSTGGKVTGMIQITVNPTKVVFNYDTAKVAFVGGDTITYQAFIDNGSTKTAIDNTKLLWRSADEAVAKVDERGVVTGVSTGSTTIAAYYKDNNKLYGAAKVIVCVLPKNDNVTKLVDNNNQPVYVYNSSSKKYVQATYADYYSGEALYSAVEITYKYTGWWTLNGKTYYFDANGNKVTGNQVILGAKYSFGSDGVLKSGTGTFGIDVSSWNGTIDWTKVAKSGVSYAIIRCGYRGSTVGGLVEDSKFATNVKNATAAGIKVGAYFFTQAITEAEAIEEASMVIEKLDGLKITYPVFIDVEKATNGRANGLTKEQRTAVVKAFCKTISNAGYKAGVYSSKTWFTNYLNASELTEYSIWLAQYASSPTYTATRYDVWQYSSTGSISGISGNVDLDLSYLGY